MTKRPAAVPAPLFVLGSVLTIQSGQALGKELAGSTGVAAVIVLRLAFAALFLLVIWRPAWPSRQDLPLVGALGAAIAGMHTIYPALERLPVGVASTLQFLGPLALALAGSRRPVDAAWALLAGLGVLLIHGPGAEVASLAGAGFALVSGAFMATYLVLNRRAGARSTGGSMLAWGVAFAAVLTAPLSVLAPAAALRPELLLAGAGVALLSAVVPWTLDMAALRRLPARVMAVMVSLEPAAGALAGLVLLGERLAWTQWLAVACVSAASAGVVITSGRGPSGAARPVEEPALTCR